MVRHECAGTREMKIEIEREDRHRNRVMCIREMKMQMEKEDRHRSWVMWIHV